VCGETFSPTWAKDRCCSVACRRSRRNELKRATPYSEAEREKDQRRYARKRGGATGRPVRRGEIAERDGYQCGICGDHVDMALEWPDPKSPSLDHVQPLIFGGAHDPDNVRLTHLDCNVARGAAIGEDQWTSLS
jgi:5-methylcytosine-specific restriction endonuclease McrA